MALKAICSALAAASLLGGCGTTAPPSTPSSRYDQLSRIPLQEGYLSKADSAALKDELLFQRAVQSYLWALPALSIYAMKEGSERQFGKGYNILPIWKERLNANTLVTTPNSDVIYAMGYLDLKQDGPMVLEVPPGLQGILDDFFQRPICNPAPVAEKTWYPKPYSKNIWCGDVGLPGPDKGKGGKYLVIPPDYQGKIPKGYIVYKSRTYNVFVFWRAFFKDPANLAEPVDLISRTKIYPLGQQATAKPMQFPDGSKAAPNMLYPSDGSAFDMLSRFIDSEYYDPADADMRGMLASIGIIKGQPFNPDAHTREILDQAGKTAFRIGRAVAYDPPPIVPNTRWYSDRKWVNPFPANTEFTGPSFKYLDMRTGFFALAYSASPAMAVSMAGMGAKYPAAFEDADGNPLSGGQSYRLHLPKDIPAGIFWSVTVYRPETASGLANGQPFPSINTMDKPAANPDGSTDIYFGPTEPAGHGKNWLKTVPGSGFFVILRLYGPKQEFFDQSWKPSDIERLK
ncbi:DUF1254 domain-containing protein [Achromobacter aegrifaciens]